MAAWDVYVKVLKRSKTNASEKNIHELRVSTQKFEAALSLARGLIDSDEPEFLIKELKRTRKRLGQLRDLQVESKKFRTTGNKRLRTFSNYIDSREKKVKKKTMHCLNGVSMELQNKSVLKIRNSLAEFEKEHSRHSIQDASEKKVKAIYDDLEKTISDPKKLKLKDIHHSRILVKRLRYQGKILDAVFGSHRLDLKALRSAQVLVGKIQDEHTLQKTMEKYLKKAKNRKDDEVFKFCKRIEKNKDKLIRTVVKNLSMIKWQS